eukprot:m51a1_g8017 hypothetical protein (482) ;mRNA; f:196130-197619
MGDPCPCAPGALCQCGPRPPAEKRQRLDAPPAAPPAPPAAGPSAATAAPATPQQQEQHQQQHEGEGHEAFARALVEASEGRVAAACALLRRATGPAMAAASDTPQQQQQQQQQQQHEGEEEEREGWEGPALLATISMRLAHSALFADSDVPLERMRARMEALGPRSLARANAYARASLLPSPAWYARTLGAQWLLCGPAPSPAEAAAAFAADTADAAGPAASGPPEARGHALYGLALCCLMGRGAQRDAPRAVGLLREAAALGHSNARVSLASRLQAGDGAPRDDAAALALLRLAAAQGSGVAQFFLARALLQGRGTPGGAPDVAGALAVLRASAARGELEPMFFLGATLRAADRGYAPALHYLGALHAAPGGQQAAALVPRDPALAALLYERAAAQGHGAACHSLAVMLLEGAALPRDDQRALALLARAAAAGFAPALARLGRLALRGAHGAQQDARAAAEMLAKAGKSGERDLGKLRAV